MKTKVMWLGCLMGVLLVSLAQGATWYGTGVQGDWFDPGNWNAGVPATGIDGGANLPDQQGPLIGLGGAGVIRDLQIGVNDQGTDAWLYMGGGDLTIERNTYIGRSHADAKGTIWVYDSNSLVDASAANSFVIGDFGSGNVIIDAGKIAAKWTRLGQSAGNVDDGGTGSITLTSGEFYTDQIFVNDNPDYDDPNDPNLITGYSASIDISGDGMLVMDAYDYGPAVHEWVTKGILTASSTDPNVGAYIISEWVDYDAPVDPNDPNDGGDGETVVTAVLADGCTTAGATAWMVGPDRSHWADSSAWNQGGAIPCADSTAGANVSNGNGVLINGGYDAACLDLMVGHTAGGTDSKLYLENGSLTVNRTFYMGRLDPNSMGTVMMSGGTLSVPNNHFYIGAVGTGNFIMDGGIVDTLKWFKIGLSGGNQGTDSGGVGYLELNGGEFHLPSSVYLNSDPTQATINITNGKLILAGNKTTAVANWVGAKNIVAFDDDPLGSIKSDYFDYDGDGVSETVVWAELLSCEPGWSQVDFDEDCDVDLDDLMVIIAEWLDERHAVTWWDEDFSDADHIGDDPANPGSGEVFVDRSGGSATYNFTDVPGMMHVTAASTFDSVDKSNVYDDDVNVVLKAKADDASGVALWQDLTTDGLSRYICWIRVMEDVSDPNHAGKQVVELLKGNVVWGDIGTQGLQDAVYVRGFDPNEVVTVTVNYTIDTVADTVTFDYEVTDGTLTKSDTDIPCATTQAGFAPQITLWAPGTGFYDDLNYEIHISPENDLTGDLKIDLLDFGILASDWLPVP